MTCSKQIELKTACLRTQPCEKAPSRSCAREKMQTIRSNKGALTCSEYGGHRLASALCCTRTPQQLSGEDEQESGESAQHEAKQLDHAEFVAGDIVDEFMNLFRLHIVDRITDLFL